MRYPKKRVVFLSLACIFSFWLLSRWRTYTSYEESIPMVGGDAKGKPPTYTRFVKMEERLPQHNKANAKNGRFLMFENSVRGLGWNNVLNEILLSTHLAWRLNMSYVFQDYAWKPSYYPWRIPESPWPRNPLTTLISGPTAGGPWDKEDYSPRAVRQNWYNKICKENDIEFINSDVAKAPVKHAQGADVLEHWIKVLGKTTKRCVQIMPTPSGEDMYPQTFDLWLIGSSRLLSLWPEFSQSPTSKLLATSPLVQSAIEQNKRLFVPRGAKGSVIENPFPRMLAAHIRRGDFHEACTRLANHNSTFYGWNLLPDLPDPFVVPDGKFEIGHTTPANLAVYLKRCLPTNQYLLDKIQSSKRDWEERNTGRTLDVMFIMTNADQEWIETFRKILRPLGFLTVVSTPELVLDEEQTGVNMAVDMELGRLAEVFIGNGWSSMTSNILHRRLVDGKEPIANRFW